MKETLEKYLQTIFTLSETSQEIRSIDVGHNLGVDRPDVFRALKTLKLCGYIDQKPYGKITLTPKGRQKAEEMALIHERISDFFVATLQLKKQDAEANAFKIEHILSDTALDAIVALSKNK